MRKFIFSLVCFLISAILFGLTCGYSEKIYLYNGTVTDGEISNRIRNTVWFKRGVGSMGLSMEDIEKIENTDGSISKYDYESIVNMIKDRITQKDYQEAERLCSLLLESFPDSPQIHYLRGALSQKTGNPDQAAQDYKFLIERDSADAPIYNNLGIIAASSKDYDQAIDLFSKAVADVPDLAEVHENLALLYMQTKDYARAIEEYNKVIESKPDNAAALYNLGMAYLNTGNFPQARAQYEKVLSLDPADDDAEKIIKYIEGKEAGEAAK